jgi:hypothetical protein
LPLIAALFSSFATANAGRYFMSSAYGITVVVAVTYAQRGYLQRLIATAGACVVVLGSVVALASRDIQKDPGHFPTSSFANFVRSYAESSGLKYGYAAYWVAMPVTWETSAKVQVYPVLACPAPHGLCRYPWHYISSWYQPRASVRTFLIVDKRFGPNDPGATLGNPDHVITFGEYTIYVYGYDIASDLGDPRAYGLNAS